MARLNQNRSTDVSNVNVWKNQNQFDYEAYDGAIVGENKMKLVSVSWESDYKNAVNWKSTDARDTYFAQTFERQIIIDSDQFQLKSAMEWSSGMGKFVGAISVYQPMESLVEYNYIVLERYETPVPGDEPRLTKYFYFISAMNILSPSTTELYLSVDAWTTFFDKVDVISMNLNRGHYAHKAIAPASFLANPLNTPVPLSTPEPDLPSVKPKVSYTNLVSLTANEPRVCIATPADLASPGSQWTSGITSSPPAGWMYNDQNGYSGNFPKPTVGNRDTASGVNGQNPTGLRVYSFTPSDFDGFINHIANRVPQLVSLIQAVYVLPASTISESAAGSIYGYSFKRVSPQPQAQKLLDLGVTPSLFGYETASRDFAKIYSSQFAEIKISDFSGRVARLAVDELAGNLSVYARANAMFPFLKVEAFINGIGGTTEKTYAVAPLHSMSAKIYESKWTEFLFNMNIPTYSVYLTGADKAMADTSGSRSLARSTASQQNSAANVANSTAKNNADASVNLSATLATRNNSLTKALNELNVDFSYYVAQQNGYASDIMNVFNEYVSQVSYDLQVTSALIGLVSSSVNSAVGIATSAGAGLLVGGPVGAAVGAAAGIVGLATSTISSLAALSVTADQSSFQRSQSIVANAVATSWASTGNFTVSNPGSNWTFVMPAGESVARKLAEGNKTRDTEILEETWANEVLAISDSSAVQLAINAANYSATAGSIAANNTASISAIIAGEQASMASSIVQYGSASGNEMDQFGLRGIEISVERISLADERVVEQTFRKYGYRVPGIWIEDPNLQQMTDFTYWECSDIWLNTSRVSDAIALIIKGMFIDGVWLWEDPANARLTKLGDNQ